MNTEIQNLEKKIDALVIRMNNVEDVLTENATKEINFLRTDLQKIIDDFDSLKIKILSDNSEQKISTEDIELLADLIQGYGYNMSMDNFTDYTTSDISDVTFDVDYDGIVKLQYATINVASYFCDSYIFNFDSLVKFIEISGEKNKHLLKYLTKELFDTISINFAECVREVNTTISANNIVEFECYFMPYEKRLKISEVTLPCDDLIEAFTDGLQFEIDDIMSAIAYFYNVDLKVDDEVDSVDANSEE